jgi:ABC-type uncharacterized transport system substrate-binding protein
VPTGKQDGGDQNNSVGVAWNPEQTLLWRETSGIFVRPLPSHLILGTDMRRREFLSIIGGMAAAWPKVAAAQQPAMPIVGYLGIRPPSAEAPYLAAFRNGLNEFEFVEGHNVALAISSAENASDRLPALASELVGRSVTVIAAAGTATARAAMNATATIPIVFVTADDPIDNGLAVNLNRPTGNATGVSMVSAELRPKMVELLHQALPNLELICVLSNPNNASVEIQTKQTEAAAAKMGLRVKILKAASPADIENAFASFSENPGSGLLVNSDPYFTGRRSQIVALAARYAVPAIYPWREYALEGGLMS